MSVGPRALALGGSTSVVVRIPFETCFLSSELSLDATFGADGLLMRSAFDCEIDRSFDGDGDFDPLEMFIG